jgi:hypothetical protein
MRKLCSLLLLAGACKKPAPPAPAQPQRFCDQDLSGVWLNASDRAFAYRFRDHGGVVRGEFQERDADGGLRNPEEPITFELHRGPDALAGVMRSTGPAPSGRTCPVEFGIKVTSCQPGALQAVVETSVPITDDCKRKPAEDGGELPPTLVEFRFERDALHPSDGGAGALAH